MKGGDSHPETSKDQAAESPEHLPEAAPTDYRRNVWILIVMIAVVLLAWIISLSGG